MRLDPEGPVSAADLVRTLPEAELADLIFTLGEEPLARKIARKLAQIRDREPIETTARLARLVLEAYGPRGRSSRMHPATRTFMALRIAVNEELDALRTLLDAIGAGAGSAGGSRSEEWLDAGGRVAMISFHSLEDRLVKRAFASLAREGRATRLTTRPIVASDAEIAQNPRARSAKLRAIRLTAD
jgi:16S rRNA (cytosine1402-N4)-methyltransferase